MIEATNSELIDALNLVAEYVEGRLSEGYSSEITLDCTESSIVLHDPRGCEVEIQIEPLISPINSAIEAAIEDDAEEAGEK